MFKIFALLVGLGSTALANYTPTQELTFEQYQKEVFNEGCAVPGQDIPSPIQKFDDRIKKGQRAHFVEQYLGYKQPERLMDYTAKISYAENPRFGNVLDVLKSTSPDSNGKTFSTHCQIDSNSVGYCTYEPDWIYARLRFEFGREGFCGVQGKNTDRFSKGYFTFEDGTIVNAYRRLLEGSGRIVCRGWDKGKGKWKKEIISTQDLPNLLSLRRCGGVDLRSVYEVVDKKGKIYTRDLAELMSFGN